MPAKSAKATTVSKPTYAVMVAESIKTLDDRTGSSLQAITKQLISSYGIDVNKTALATAIKKGVESGDLVKVKASFKIGKKKPAVKPSAVKPKVTKKPAKKKAAPAKAAITKKVRLPRIPMHSTHSMSRERCHRRRQNC